MAELKTLNALHVAKLNIFADNEGGDVDLELSIIAREDDRRRFLRLEMTAAGAWWGFDLDPEEAETFAAQVNLGLLALKGAVAEQKKPPRSSNE